MIDTTNHSEDVQLPELICCSKPVKQNSYFGIKVGMFLINQNIHLLCDLAILLPGKKHLSTQRPVQVCLKQFYSRYPKTETTQVSISKRMHNVNLYTEPKVPKHTVRKNNKLPIYEATMGTLKNIMLSQEPFLKREHAAGFHLCVVLEQANLLYGGKKNESSCFLSWKSD